MKKIINLSIILIFLCLLCRVAYSKESQFSILIFYIDKNHKNINILEKYNIKNCIEMPIRLNLKSKAKFLVFPINLAFNEKITKSLYPAVIKRMTLFPMPFLGSSRLHKILKAKYIAIPQIIKRDRKFLIETLIIDTSSKEIIFLPVKIYSNSLKALNCSKKEAIEKIIELNNKKIFSQDLVCSGNDTYCKKIDRYFISPSNIFLSKDRIYLFEKESLLRSGFFINHNKDYNILSKPIDKYLESKYGFLEEPQIFKKINKITYNLESKIFLNNISFRFKILNTLKIKSFHGPQRFIYISKGLLNSLKSDDELVFLIALEIAKFINSNFNSYIRDFKIDKNKISYKIAEDVLKAQETENEIIYDKIALLYMEYSGYKINNIINGGKFLNKDINLKKSLLEIKSLVSKINKIRKIDSGIGDYILQHPTPYLNNSLYLDEFLVYLNSLKSHFSLVVKEDKMMKTDEEKCFEQIQEQDESFYELIPIENLRSMPKSNSSIEPPQKIKR